MSKTVISHTVTTLGAGATGKTIIFGICRETTIGELLPPEDQAIVESALIHIRGRGEPVEVECRYIVIKKP
jgi:hypothetical protein